jgi:hypothetical protein
MPLVHKRQQRWLQSGGGWFEALAESAMPIPQTAFKSAPASSHASPGEGTASLQISSIFSSGFRSGWRACWCGPTGHFCLWRS